MSRSYKKYPRIKDHNKGMKRFANKKVRKYNNLPSRRAYKKVFCSYNISDYNFGYWSLNELKSDEYVKDRWWRYYFK